MAVLWAHVEVHKAYAEVHEAYVEPQKAYVEVHKSQVGVHKACVEVHRTLGTHRNSRASSQGKVPRLYKQQYIRLVLLYKLSSLFNLQVCSTFKLVQFSSSGTTTNFCNNNFVKQQH